MPRSQHSGLSVSSYKSSIYLRLLFSPVQSLKVTHLQPGKMKTLYGDNSTCSKSHVLYMYVWIVGKGQQPCVGV